MTAGRKPPRTWTGKAADGTEHTAPGAAPGTFLSDFALPNLNGEVLRVSDQVGTSYIFLFVDAACGPSEDVLREMARLRRKPGSNVPRAIIASAGDAGAVRELATRYETGPDVVLQNRHELFTFYRIPATPAAYLVDETRRTVGNLAVGKHDVIGLLRGKANARSKKTSPGDSTPVKPLPKVRLAAGDLAPEIVVSAPEGFSISLSAHRGRRVLLVLWSEACPFCDQVVAACARVPGSVSLIMVGREGESRPNLPSGQLFGTQDRTDVMDALGLYQLPTTVLLDSSGRLERDPVSGTGDVVALIGSLAE